MGDMGDDSGQRECLVSEKTNGSNAKKIPNFPGGGKNMRMATVLWAVILAGVVGISSTAMASFFGHGGKFGRGGSCELLMVEVDQEADTIIITGKNLIRNGTPKVRFMGVELDIVPDPSATEIVASLDGVELAEVTKSYLLEVVRGRYDYKGCPKYMVTVVPDSPADTGPKVVFMTSTTYDGDLGGLDGADDKCQQLAEAQNLDGTFIAWLSTPSINAITRLEDANAEGPWYNLNPAGGELVSATRAGLEDGSIDNAIRYTESGGEIVGSTPKVWTGTLSNGKVCGAAGAACTCGGWTNNTNGLGDLGTGTASDATWTQRTFGQICAGTQSFELNRLFCFQVD
jgi:hypothetical protein